MPHGCNVQHSLLRSDGDLNARDGDDMLKSANPLFHVTPSYIGRTIQCEIIQSRSAAASLGDVFLGNKHSKMNEEADEVEEEEAIELAELSELQKDARASEKGLRETGRHRRNLLSPPSPPPADECSEGRLCAKFDFDYIMRNCVKGEDPGWGYRMEGWRRRRRQLLGNAPKGPQSPKPGFLVEGPGKHTCCAENDDVKFCIFTEEQPMDAPVFVREAARRTPPPSPPSPVSPPRSEDVMTPAKFSRAEDGLLTTEAMIAMRASCEDIVRDDHRAFVSGWSLIRNKTDDSVSISARCIDVHVGSMPDDAPEKDASTCSVAPITLGPTPMVGHTVKNLGSQAVSCPANQALASWEYAADARPWYGRDDTAYSLQGTCCTLGSRSTSMMCQERKSRCIEKSDPEATLPDLSDFQAASCYANEVMTEMRWTGDECDINALGRLGFSGGSMRVVSTCCTVGEPLDSEDEGILATDAAKDEEDASDGEILERADRSFAPQSKSSLPGPLIDEMILSEGASYVDRKTVDAANWGTIFDEVMPTVNDINTPKFCRRSAISTFPIDDLLEPCNEDGDDVGEVVKRDELFKFEGCYDGLISYVGLESDGAFRLMRIPLGSMDSSLFRNRASRALDTCASECKGYTHMVTAVNSITGYELTCVCTFALLDFKETHAKLNDDECAVRSKGVQFLGNGPMAAAFELPDPIDERKVAYEGCSTEEELLANLQSSGSAYSISYLLIERTSTPINDISSDASRRCVQRCARYARAGVSFNPTDNLYDAWNVTCTCAFGVSPGAVGVDTGRKVEDCVRRVRVYSIPPVSIGAGLDGDSASVSPPPGLTFKGCFETTHNDPILEMYVGARPAIDNGRGYESLKECAERCIDRSMEFVAMNKEGCWCDHQYGMGGEFKRLGPEECVGGDVSFETCGVGPCGDDALRVAVYAIAVDKSSTPTMESGADNVMFKVSMTLTVAFSAKWGFKAKSTAFDGSVVISLARTGRTLFRGPLNQAIFVKLEPGTYQVAMYGVNALPPEALHDVGRSENGLLFKQESHCGKNEWGVLNSEAVEQCTKLSSPDEPIDSPEEDDSVDDTTGKDRMAALRAETDGAFLSMSVGGVERSAKGLMNAKSSVAANNYLYLQARAKILILTVVLDISIKVGKAEEGGGIMMYFLIQLAAGSTMLAEIEGHLDLVPLDIEGMMSFDIKALTSLKLIASITIKPHVINVLLRVVNPVLQAAVMLIMLPVLLGVLAAQIVLQAILLTLEAAMYVLNALKSGLDRATKRLNARFEKVSNREDFLKKLEHKRDGELYIIAAGHWCQQNQNTNYRALCSSDSPNKPQECSWKILEQNSETPLNCGQMQAQAAALRSAFYSMCCTWGKKILRFFWRIIIRVVGAVVSVILGVFKLILDAAALVVRGIQSTVKLAEENIRRLAAPVTDLLGGLDNFVNDDNVISIPKFTRWVFKTTIVQLHEMTVGGQFSMQSRYLMARIVMVLLGHEIDWTLKFTFSFKEILKGLVTFIKDAFKAIFSGGKKSSAMSSAALGAVAPAPQMSGHAAMREAAEHAKSSKASFSSSEHQPDDLTNAFHQTHRAFVAPRQLNELDRPILSDFNLNSLGNGVSADFMRKQFSDRDLLGEDSGTSWWQDHVGDEILVEEGESGRHARQEHDLYAAALAHVAALHGHAGAWKPLAAAAAAANSSTEAALNALNTVPAARLHAAPLLREAAVTLSSSHPNFISRMTQLLNRSPVDRSALNEPGIALTTSCLTDDHDGHVLRLVSREVCSRVKESRVPTLEKLARSCADRGDRDSPRRAGRARSSLAARFSSFLGVNEPTLRELLADREGAAIFATAIHEARSDPCETAATSAALTCSATDARGRWLCAASLSTLHSTRCVSAAVSSPHLRSCASIVERSLPCSKSCARAMASVARDCGSIVPRLSDGKAFSPSNAVCMASLHSAQDACAARIDAVSNGAESVASDVLADGEKDDKDNNAFCTSLLDASPLGLEDIGMRAESHLVRWSEQGLGGLVPVGALCDNGAVGLVPAPAPRFRHVDLRGNNLVGTVPHCALGYGGARAPTALLLSRNRLTGSLGALGSHQRHVSLNENSLSGSLGAALAGAHNIESLDVSGNNFSGTLEVLRGKTRLRRLGLRGNNFVDSPSAPVADILASMQMLQSYDISGNNFSSVSATAPLGDDVQGTTHSPNVDRVHLVLTLRSSIASFCPMCPTAAHEHNCGDVAYCRARPPVLQDILAAGPDDATFKSSVALHLPEARRWDEDVDRIAALECEVQRRAAVAANVSTDYVDVRMERIFPFYEPDAPHRSIASLTVRVGNQGRVDQIRDALGDALTGESLRVKHGSCGTAASESSDVPEDIYLGVVERSEARLGCPSGWHGTKCQYFCATRWQRFSDEIYPESSGISVNARLGDRKVEYYREDKDDAEMTVFNDVEDHVDVFDSAGRASSPVASIKARLDRYVIYKRNARRPVNIHGDGEDHSIGRISHAFSLDQCTSACRGHASLALETCTSWLSDKLSQRMHGDCLKSLRHVGHYCGVSWDRDCSGPREPSSNSGCAVCGLHHYFSDHGVYLDVEDRDAVFERVDSRHLMMTHVDAEHDVGPETGLAVDELQQHHAAGADHFRTTATHYAMRLIEHDTAAFTAGGGDDNIDPMPEVGSMLGGAVDVIHNHNLEAIVRGAIEETHREKYDGDDEKEASMWKSYEAGLGSSSDVAEVETPPFSIIDKRMRAQFPMCQADVKCSAACRAEMDAALQTCLAFIDEPANASVDDCRAKLASGRKICAAAKGIDMQRCYDAVAEGFHNLGVPRDPQNAFER